MARYINVYEAIEKITDEMSRQLEQQSKYVGKSIGMVNNIRHIITGLAKALDILHEQPTIDQPRWIPISEKLPKKGSRVLVTVDFDKRFVCEIDYWEDARKAEWDMEQMHFMESITAWMPLPKPYKEEG